MKQLLLGISILLLCSCNRDPDFDTDLIKNNLFFNLDLKENGELFENPKIYNLECRQDINFPFEFRDKYFSHHTHIFFPVQSEDSVTIYGTFAFESNINFGFEKKTIWLDLELSEAKKNLVKVGDFSYAYKSKAFLYKRLKEILREEEKPQIYFTVYIPSFHPDLECENKSWSYSSPFSSKNDDFETKFVHFDEEEETIFLNINLVREDRIKRCGFKFIHEMENAQFQIQIN